MSSYLVSGYIIGDYLSVSDWIWSIFG